jgi:putative phosphoserine phosphatase/1-acylglycerol-3-phosphate O-acyltransferase
MALADHLKKLDAGPRGPQVGAFFDLDGTLVAGFTANAFFTDQVKRRQIGVLEAAKTIAAAIDGTYLGGDPLKGGDKAFAAVAGQTEDTLADLGERLFVQKIARTIRREARELVKAHQRLGHTVVISSAATAYQVRPVARDLGIEHLVCTELEVDEEGVLTGAVRGRMRWGREKATGVRAFARAHEVDLRVSYGYGNGVEDIDFLATVGSPVALSPDPGLRRAAGRFGWPVLDLRDPLSADVVSAARTAAALGGMNAGALTGFALGVATGSRSRGRRTAVALASEAALRVAGVDVRVIGAQHLDSARPAVVVANHQSAIDPVVVASLLRAGLHRRGQAGGPVGPASRSSARCCWTRHTSTAATPHRRARPSTGSPTGSAGAPRCSSSRKAPGRRPHGWARSGAAPSIWPCRPACPCYRSCYATPESGCRGTAR